MLSCTMSGNFLPPQIIYTGKTTKCHPNFKFPSTWNITHTESHWSNEATMLEYAERILLPYVQEKREIHGANQKALVIFDVFAAHRCSSFIEKLREMNCEVLFIPAGCTGELQPLDVMVNDAFKKLMKNEFTDWYSGEVAEAISDEQDPANVHVPLTLTIVKPEHAKWLVKSMQALGAKIDIIRGGFQKSGIMGAVLSARGLTNLKKKTRIIRNELEKSGIVNAISATKGKNKGSSNSNNISVNIGTSHLTAHSSHLQNNTNVGNYATEATPMVGRVIKSEQSHKDSVGEKMIDQKDNTRKNLEDVDEITEKHSDRTTSPTTQDDHEAVKEDDAIMIEIDDDDENDRTKEQEKKEKTKGERKNIFATLWNYF